MEDNLIEILSQFNYPVIRQGSIAEGDKYPDHFFTFWNNNSPDHAYYDNRDYGTAWMFDVNFYSIDPEKTYSVLSEARKKLKENKWIVPGKGYDVLSDEPSHTGRGMEAHFLEIES